MKNIFYFLSVLTLWSCSQTTPEETIEQNTAPEVPTLLNPTNNLLCISSDLTFEWATSIDNEGDPINYFYQIATDNMFNTVVKSGTLKDTKKNLQLEKETTYYWRVQAIDETGEKSDFSETRNLYTENIADENHLPFMPELISPIHQSETNNQLILLEWNCADIDNDPLVYDVYVGTTNSPSLYAEGISKTSIELSIESNTTYYWRVDARDSKNGKTLGQTWVFNNN
ncbi:hypothetical protein [Flavicella marina]|uniref:hypothetical protein n=1 Tax=Flavicella marina TaxID=1475951 RepID=UPI0012659781|nr:hypothetical protein [Flavicella marina]